MTTLAPLLLEHTIRVPASPLRTLDFFTPKGEMAWLPGWSPRFLDPADGASGVGLTFESVRDGITTHWIMVDYDPAAGLARYARITPGISSVILSVTCAADGEETRATIAYRIVPLGTDDTATRRFADGFVDMIEGWRRLLVEHLQREDTAAAAATA